MPQRPAVLIVDDDRIYLTIAEAMVKRMGYPVMVAGDGKEAISLYEKHADDIGCVLLDIQMPRMNGIAVLEHLRKIREDARVIIVSGYINLANRERLDPLHPLEYLNKPVEYQTLMGILGKYMPGKKR